MVEPLGDQLLAGAALADHQHRAVERRGAARALDRVEEREALADELVCPLHRSPIQILTDCWWESHDLARIFERFRTRK